MTGPAETSRTCCRADSVARVHPCVITAGCAPPGGHPRRRPCRVEVLLATYASGDPESEVPMAWQLGGFANLVVAIAYLLIAGAIFVPLLRSAQLRANPLGTATAAIFFTCAVHHGSHFVHLYGPSFGI